MASGRFCISVLRRRTFTVVKTVSLLLVLSFLWIQLRMASFQPEFLTRRTQSARVDQAAAAVVPTVANLSGLSTMNLTNRVMEIARLRKAISEMNREQRVLNADKFGPLSQEDVVVVVQVHNRRQYLYALIESLRQARDIEKSLLVFSHDVFDAGINYLVQQIEFCKVIQIFYPHSIQLHPHEFPGEDPNDCPRNIARAEAEERKCNNAHSPDHYGHYREASFTQTKHHWWWKTNHVMDGMNATRGHQGLFLFLEEDHYVAPDFLPVLHLMDKLRQSECQHCDILTLGTYTKTFNYAHFSKKVEAVKWLSSKHNMGMVLSRPSWNKIRKCAKAFCTYDDYNWDWSLQHVSTNCLPQPLVAMVVLAPRVFHIGECGVHHKGKDCSSNQVVQRVARALSVAHQHLFPNTLSFRKGFQRPFKPPKKNGGWGDVRDHELCLNQVYHLEGVNLYGNQSAES